MVYYATAFVLALAGSAIARMPTAHDRFAARRARRSLGQRRTTPNQRLTSSRTGTPSPGEKEVSYSSNWSGAVISEAEGTWTGVTGKFKVPTPKTPSGGSSSTTYSASAWVGIDGDTCQTAIWQTGVDFNVEGSSVSYDAWYEWYPDYADDFSGITFSAGDIVTLTVTATSKTSGKATIENSTKGKTVTKTISNSGYDLCQEDAEWIVEDFEECEGSSCSLVPLANFGKVHFTKSAATSASGSSTPADGEVIDIRQNGTVYTKVVTHPHGVTITYV